MGTSWETEYKAAKGTVYQTKPRNITVDTVNGSKEMSDAAKRDYFTIGYRSQPIHCLAEDTAREAKLKDKARVQRETERQIEAKRLAAIQRELEEEQIRL